MSARTMYFVDVAGNVVLRLPYVAAPDAELLRRMLCITFPDLGNVPFAISFDSTAGFVPYTAASFNDEPGRKTVRLHAVDSVGLDVPRGSQKLVDDRMLRSRTRSGPASTAAASPSFSRKSRKSTRDSSPASVDHDAGVEAGRLDATKLAEAMERKKRKDEREGLQQAAMRNWCLRRDQCCVITGDTDESALKCAHLLTLEFGADWFKERERERKVDETVCGHPVVAGRYEYYMDCRNGFMLTATLHEKFDSFRFLFSPVSGLENGTEIILPQVRDRLSPPTYYRDLFPHPSVVVAHFEQAVRYNAKGATEPEEDFFHEEGMVDVEASPFWRGGRTMKQLSASSKNESNIGNPPSPSHLTFGTRTNPHITQSRTKPTGPPLLGEDATLVLNSFNRTSDGESVSAQTGDNGVAGIVVIWARAGKKVIEPHISQTFGAFGIE